MKNSGYTLITGGSMGISYELARIFAENGHDLVLVARSEADLKQVKNELTSALLPGAADTDFFHKANMESSKAVQDKSKLSDPAQVAKDGYDALMSGDDKVISGFKNKMTVAGSNMMTDSMAADMMKKNQEPVNSTK